MALSGSIQTSYYNGVEEQFPHYLIIDWSAKQNVANNTSTITWTCRAEDGEGDYYVYAGPVEISFDKTSVLSLSDRFKLVKGQQIGAGTITFTHNSAGKKSVSLDVQATLYEYETNSTYEGLIELDDILRASSISSIDGNMIGSPITININRLNDSYTHKVYYSFGDQKNYLLSDSVTTSCQFTPSLANCKYIPNSTSGTATIRVDTYNGSNKIGTTSKNFTLHAPDSVIPTINNVSISVDNSENATIEEWGLYVRGYSKVSINIDAEGIYDSKISSYKIEGGNNVVTSSMPYTSPIINRYGDLSYICTVKDSRGRESEPINQTIKVYDYKKPSIHNFKVERDLSNTSKIIASFQFNYYTVNNKNSIIAIISYAEKGSSDWKEAYRTTETDVTTTLSDVFAEDKSYVFLLRVMDGLSNEVNAELTVSTVQVMMDFRSGGKGFGIGKICEGDNFEVGFQSKFFEDANMIKNLQVDGILTASNLRIDTFLDANIVLSDFGLLTKEIQHGFGIYIIKPFNLVYLRAYFAGLASDIASSNTYTTLCTLKEKFKPSASVALFGSAVKDFSVVLKSTGNIDIVPRNGFSTANALYVSGVYFLDSNSELY